ncbi:MAG: peptidyl-tRNA hydrolase, partial [Nitrosopumilus sp.]|nr:peptidyl-tRNA hydrolase [Nitrosopumilus sp.]
AAQVGHACVMGAERVRLSRPEWYEGWQGLQMKVVVRVDGMDGIDDVRRRAADANLPWSQVADAGRTQLEPGTVTCISVGPAPSDLVDGVTGDLRLL